jgi:hypothetical protein
MSKASQILRFLPDNAYQAARLANAPSASNVYATMLDIPVVPPSINGIKISDATTVIEAASHALKFTGNVTLGTAGGPNAEVTVNVTGGGGSGGEVNTASNAGSSASAMTGLYYQKVNEDLQFYSLISSNGSIDIDLNTADSVIDLVANPAQTTTTASNLGTGAQGLFKQKTGVDLEFYSLKSSDGRIDIDLVTQDNVVDLQLDLKGTLDDDIDLDGHDIKGTGGIDIIGDIKNTGEIVNTGNTTVTGQVSAATSRVTGLAGTGTRMVITDANGLLGEQAIPTPSGGGNPDFSGLSAVTAKVDLTSVTSQPQYGHAEKYTALGAILVGQPVVYDYTGGVLKVRTASSSPAQNSFVGVALETVADGDPVNIITEGMCTVRLGATPLSSSDTYALPSSFVSSGSFNNVRALTNNSVFTDINPGANNYADNTYYGVTYDVGTGSEHMVMNITDFEFEGSTTSLFDKFYIEVSNDNINYEAYNSGGSITPAHTNIPWLQTMADMTYPFSSNSYAGGSNTANAAKNGSFFPIDPSTAATLNGGTAVTGVDWHLTDDGTATGNRYRYVKFTLFSDGSSTRDGWDITLKPSVLFPGATVPIPPGQLLYVDPSDFSQVITGNAGNLIMGMSAYSDTSNDSLFIRLLHLH